jgi:hypothetical protein
VRTSAFTHRGSSGRFSCADLYRALMWMDQRGVAHTVALPDPATLMSDRFRASLDAVVAVRHAEVSALLERMEDGIYKKVSSMHVDGEHELQSPPEELLDGEVWSEQELKAALEQIDLRCRSRPENPTRIIHADRRRPRFYDAL